MSSALVDWCRPLHLLKVSRNMLDSDLQSGTSCESANPKLKPKAFYYQVGYYEAFPNLIDQVFRAFNSRGLCFQA